MSQPDLYDRWVGIIPIASLPSRYRPDGDTRWGVEDAGEREYRVRRYRLARINAPELTSLDGPLARDYLELQLQAGRVPRTILGLADDLLWMPCRTVLDTADNYGRLLLEVFTGDGLNLNDVMVQTGHAAYEPGAGPYGA